jgi:hypothetical protein
LGKRLNVRSGESLSEQLDVILEESLAVIFCERFDDRLGERLGER